MKRFSEGTRVVFRPTPAARMMYESAPPTGAEGTVVAINTGTGFSTMMPGPRGGLVYVDWDGYRVEGVFANDVERVGGPRRRGARRRNPSGLEDEAGAWRDEIIDQMARTLWVNAYASAVDELGRQRAIELGLDVAGPGDDWMDVAPDEPSEARRAADRLAAAYRRANNVKQITDLLAMAAEADAVVSGVEPADLLDERYVEEFADSLALMALGTGVSWFDDHAVFDLHVPPIEVHADIDPDGEVDFHASVFAANPGRKLTAARRRALPKREFAVPPAKWDPDGGLPIDTPGRTRAAMARFGQYDWSKVPARERSAIKRRAFKRIVRRARELGIDPSGFESRWKRSFR